MLRTVSRIFNVGAALFLVACGRDAGPIENFVGTYTLESVNGRALPASVPSTDGCSHSVSGGTLSLNQPASATGPLFIWTAYIMKSCSGAEEAVTPSPEMGEWSTDGEKISFDPKSGQNYDGVGYGAANSRSVEISFGKNIYHFTNASRATQ